MAVRGTPVEVASLAVRLIALYGDTWASTVWQYDMAVRMVVEGYPPDESLQWDETNHITSL